MLRHIVDPKFCLGVSLVVMLIQVPTPQVESSELVGNVRLAGAADDVARAAQLIRSCRARFKTVDQVIEAYRVQLTIRVNRADVVFGGMVFPKPKGNPYYLDIEAVLLLPSASDLGKGKTPRWATTRCMVIAHEVEEARTRSHPSGVQRENDIRDRLGMPKRSGDGKVTHGDHTDALVAIEEHIERFHLSQGPPSYVVGIGYNPQP